jgi:predicted aminopeptidase
LLLKDRKALEQNYAVVDRSDNEKRAVKARLFQGLKDEYQALKGNWGGYAGYDRFFEQPLSNAHLASIATYEDFVPAFRAMLRREGSFPRFYKAVKRLAELDRADRHRILKGLAPPAPSAPLMVQRSETPGGVRH